MPRQALAVALQRDSPWSRVAQPLLQVRSQSPLRRAARPALPTRPRLDSVAAQEPHVRLPLHTEIPEAWDVRPAGPPAVDVLVQQPGHDAARTRLGDVVHHVVAQLAARVGQAGREARALRVQQDLRRGEGRGAQENQPPGVVARRLGMRVDHAHAHGAVGPLVVDDAVHDRVGDDTELAGLPRGRQRGAQAREVASVAAATRALVTRLAGAAAVVRSGQVGNPGPWRITLQGYGECLPRHENYVDLDPERKDQWGIPLLRVHCAWSANERAIREDVKTQAAEMLEATGCRNVETYDDDGPPGFSVPG